MGGMMSSLAVAASCCVGSCVSKVCCSCCSGEMRTSGKKAKNFYLFIQGLAIIFALTMRYWGGDQVDIMDYWSIGCTDQNSITVPGCKGNAAVYRISFMQAVFFLVMTAGCYLSQDFHLTHACSKLLLWFGLMLSSFFIPNYVFNNSGYAWFSRVVSVLFLLAQIIILIDFGYKWNDAWLAKADEQQRKAGAGAGMNKWHYAILGVAVTCFFLWLLGVSLMFKSYSVCGLDKFFTAMTLILVLIATGIALATESPILPAAIVAAYAVFLNWGAITANPDHSCGADAAAIDRQSPAIIATGIAITAVSLVWVSMSTADSAKTLQLEFQDKSKKKEAQSTDGAKARALIDGETDSDGSSDVEAGIKTRDVTITEADRAKQQVLQEDEDDRRGVAGARRQEELDAADSEKYWVFHLVMFFAAVYMAMLLTDWGSNPDPANTQATPTSGKTSMWVKVVSQWTTCLLYTWTLLAPRVLPDRDWS